MVTKGYRKGVYVRVTEGTLSGIHRNIGSLPDIEGLNLLQSGARQGGQQKYQDTEKGGPWKAPDYMPNNDAHRPNPPRGGDRE